MRRPSWTSVSDGRRDISGRSAYLFNGAMDERSPQWRVSDTNGTKTAQQRPKTSIAFAKAMSMLSARSRRCIVAFLVAMILIAFLSAFTNGIRRFGSYYSSSSVGDRNMSYYMKPQTLANVKRIKEVMHAKYEHRLDSIKNFCANRQPDIPKVLRNNAENITQRWRNEMWWDLQNGFAWCCVYKVSSSTLVTHMINIAGWDWDEYLQHLVDLGIERRKWREYMIEELYHLPDDINLREANDNLMLMAYVRNPFSRLASGYLEKFVHEWTRLNDSMEYKWLRDRILVNYRLSGDFENPLPYPTPLEFAKYVLDESKRIGVEYLDIHFRPQWFSCPFCSMNFDMIGSAEEFESDFDLFTGEYGITEKIDRSLRLNDQRQSEDPDHRARRFFSQLPRATIQDLYYAFKIDFDMFGYEEPWKYIEMGYIIQEDKEIGRPRKDPVRHDMPPI